MNTDRLRDIIYRERLVRPDQEVTFTPLSGGVSSDIWLAQAGQINFVVKAALSKLKVADEWHAHPRRNRAEQAFLHYIGSILPDSVPKMLYADQEEDFFIMRYVGQPFDNWKQELLEGIWLNDRAARAAWLLAEIHRHSYSDPSRYPAFDNQQDFYDLRLEPYLVTTGEKHPDLQHMFDAEVERLKNTRLTLIHGDYSPKNMMVTSMELVLLDHEVATYGDPSFDLAFLLKHLMLKRLYLRSRKDLPDLEGILWHTYLDHSTQQVLHQHVKLHTSKLLLMLLLARVDGKSPVEYLSEEKQNVVRGFVTTVLSTQAYSGVPDILRQWQQMLQ